MIDVNTFTSEVKTNSWMALCYRHQPSLPLNHRRRYYLLHFPVAAAVQGSPGWHVGCFLGVYVEGDYRSGGSGRHRRPLGTFGCRRVRNHCLIRCVQKPAAQDVHPLGSSLFFIGD